MSTFIHKNIAVDGGEMYLPFALGRIRALEQLPGPLSQSYAIDSVIIRVKVNCPEGHHYVDIVAGDEIAFDFFTPTSWMDDYDPTTVLTYGGVEGVFTSVVFYSSGDYKCVPLASREISGGKYRTVKVADSSGIMLGGTLDYHEVPLGKIWNLQKQPQYVWWQGEIVNGEPRYTKNFCVSSYGNPNFYNGVPRDLRDYAVNHRCGKTTGWYLSPLGQQSSEYMVLRNEPSVIAMSTDIGQDLGLTYYSSDKDEATEFQPTTVMPRFLRRGCVRKVNDPVYGSREFVIYTDTFSNFEIFPVGAPDADGQPSRTKNYPKPEYRRRFKFSDIAPEGVVIPTTDSMSRGWLYDGFLLDPSIETRPDGQQKYKSWAWGNFVPSSPTNMDDIGFVYDYIEMPQDPFDLVDDDALIDPSWDQSLYYQRHQYLWRFNSMGTRVVARVNANERSVLSTLKDMDGAYTLQPGDSNTSGFGQKLFANSWLPFTPLKKPKYCFGGPYLTPDFVANHASFFNDKGGIEDAKVYDHYILEMDIQITLTGYGYNDYTASVTSRRMLTNAMGIAADYAHGNTVLKSKGVKQDDLIVLEVSCFWGVHANKQMRQYFGGSTHDTSYAEGRLRMRNYGSSIGVTPKATYLDIVCSRSHWIYLKYAQHSSYAFNSVNLSNEPSPHETSANITPKLGRYRWTGNYDFIKGVPYTTSGLDGWVNNNGHLYHPPVVTDHAAGLNSNGSWYECFTRVTGFDLRALAIEMTGFFHDLSLTTYSKATRRFDVRIAFGKENFFHGDRDLYNEYLTTVAGMQALPYDYGQMPRRSTDPDEVVKEYEMRDNENDLMIWGFGKFSGLGPNAPVYLPMLEVHAFYSACQGCMNMPTGGGETMFTHPSGGITNSRAPTVPTNVGYNNYTNEYVVNMTQFPTVLPTPTITYIDSSGKETVVNIADALFSAWGLSLDPNAMRNDPDPYYQNARMQEHLCRFGIWRQLTRRETVPDEFVLEVY